MISGDQHHQHHHQQQQQQQTESVLSSATVATSSVGDVGLVSACSGVVLVSCGGHARFCATCVATTLKDVLYLASELCTWISDKLNDTYLSLHCIKSPISLKSHSYYVTKAKTNMLQWQSTVNLSQLWGRFFIASERSDRSSPVCLSFFYSSARFVPRFLMTD